MDRQEVLRNVEYSLTSSGGFKNLSTLLFKTSPGTFSDETTISVDWKCHDVGYVKSVIKVRVFPSGLTIFRPLGITFPSESDVRSYFRHEILDLQDRIREIEALLA